MPPREIQMWTKEEIRQVLDLWEKHSTDQIADILGRNRNSVTQMAVRLRLLGAKIPQKKRRGLKELLVKEVIAEL